MYRTILLISLCLPLTLSALSSPDRFFKAKVNTNNDVFTIRFYMRHPMVGHEYYGNRVNLKEDYITHITAINEDQVILDISTSPYLRKYPRLQHKFKVKKTSNLIHYLITDNKAETRAYLYDFKKRKITQPKVPSIQKNIIDYRKLKPKVWKASTIKEALHELYGDIENPIKDKITIEEEQDRHCEESIPVHITSDIDLESIAIFNDTIMYPTVAIISVPKDGIIDYELYLQMFTTCTDYTIVIMAKGRDGNFYTTRSKARIACADSCGGGG